MDTDGMIDALNAALSIHGERVSLRRIATPPATGVTATADCLAVMTGYGPAELVPGSGIIQEDQRMILSPTPLAQAAFPGIPKRGDRVLTVRGAMTVQASMGIYVQGVLVRIEAQVRGA